MTKTVMQRLLNAAGWDAGSTRHKQFEDAMAGAGLALVDRAVDIAQCGSAYEAAKWPNGCDKTVPQALRYLAEHDRPIGGQSYFNSEHLHQLAGEIERMAKCELYRKRVGFAPTATPRSPAPTTRGVCLDCGVVDDDDHAPGCSALAIATRSPAACVTADQLALEIYRADSDNDGFEPATETRMYRDGYLVPATALLQKFDVRVK